MSQLYEPLTSSEEERSYLMQCDSRRERGLIIVAGTSTLLAGLMLLTVVLVHMEYSDAHRHVQELQKLCGTTPGPTDASTELPADTVCTTPNCVISAARLLSHMDAEADPCQDFFRYACGRWPAVHPRPSELPSWSEFGRAERTLRGQLGDTLQSREAEDLTGAAGAARQVYQHCINMTSRDLAGVAPLTAALERVGGWPALTEQWGSQNFSWAAAAVMAALYTGGQAGTQLVNLWVSADERNATRHLLHVDQAVLGLGRGILTDPDTHADVHTAYEHLITGTLAMLHADQHGSANQSVRTVAADTASEIRQFEVQLARLTVPEEDRRNSSRMYNKMTLGELQELTDQVHPDTIRWTELVGLFLALGTTNSSAPPDDDMEVVVAEPDFMKNLTRLLNETDDRTLANYVGWRIVLSSLAGLNSEAADLMFKFQKVLSGKQSPTPMETVCFDWLNEVMGPAMSYIYVTKFFPEDRKEKVSAMVSDMRTVFSQRLDNITWMDNNTLHQAHDKLEQMVANVAYPDWMVNSTALNDYFQGFEAQQEQFNNYANLNQLEIIRNVALLSEPVDRTKFIGYPSVVNAFYEPTINSITIPAAILQSIFYGNGLEVLNYAAIGGVIGHEMTHGFDDIGRQYDAEGSMALWWSVETLAEFQRRVDCVVQQYSNYSLPELQGLMNDTHVNGLLTVGENIADGGGLDQAHQAYFERYQARHGPEPSLPALTHLTADQLFFIAYGQLWCTSDTPEYLRGCLLSDPHSPRQFRVQGAVSNSAAFAAAFSCPAGTPMNPEHKCAVW